MKRFLVITVSFLVPIVLLIGYVVLNYKPEIGDLRRMSYLQMKYDYKQVFPSSQQLPHQVISIDTSIIQKKKWKILTIGDSFFQQRSFGLVNYLSYKYSGEVVNFGRSYLLYDNPLLTLQGLVNSDYFDSVKVDFVLFESVERYIVERALYHNREAIYGFEEIQDRIKQHAEEKPQEEKRKPYPTDRLVKFPLNNIAYLFSPTGANGDVYKEKTTQNLFSTSKNDILFFREDVDKIELNNQPGNCEQLNEILNEISLSLKQKGIQLIVLVIPDKFDVYYPYISNKDNYVKPLFFNNFNELPKGYLTIDTEAILSNEVANGEKDIYLYDDTHTSPKASQALLKELEKFF